MAKSPKGWAFKETLTRCALDCDAGSLEGGTSKLSTSELKPSLIALTCVGLAPQIQPDIAPLLGDMVRRSRCGHGHQHPLLGIARACCRWLQSCLFTWYVTSGSALRQITCLQGHLEGVPMPAVPQPVCSSLAASGRSISSIL